MIGGYTIRTTTESDARSILACADAAVPFDKRGNRRWLQLRHAAGTEKVQRQFVAVGDGGRDEAVVGYGSLEQQGAEARLGA